jgi:CheY-like chemotaxis protein
MPKPHLLLIDNDGLLRRTLARGLGRDFTIYCANDGETALEMINEGATDVALFDVILCDLNLPRMSGHDLYDVLTRSAPDLAARFVIITGAELAEDDAFAAMLGDRYLGRMTSMTELSSLLRRIAFPRLSSPCAPLVAA